MTGPTKILVVEDDQGSRITLTGLLEAEGYRVETCETARESLNYLIHHPVHVVVSDLRLPDGNGLQILWALNNINPDAAFILITGHATLETAIEAANQGAFAYHVKPLDIDALKASIRNALRQQRLEIDKRDLLAKVQEVNAELKDSMTELETKNRELHHSLAKVKLLTGLLPICSSCKKIRNDAGYWDEIEKYIVEHSEADFTHGICRDCIKELYPDAYRQLYPSPDVSDISESTSLRPTQVPERLSITIIQQSATNNLKNRFQTEEGCFGKVRWTPKFGQVAKRESRS